MKKDIKFFPLYTEMEKKKIVSEIIRSKNNVESIIPFLPTISKKDAEKIFKIAIEVNVDIELLFNSLYPKLDSNIIDEVIMKARQKGVSEKIINSRMKYLQKK